MTSPKKRTILGTHVVSAFLVAATLLAGCEVKEPDYIRHPSDDPQFTGIFGINLQNFPRLDGSTSARALALVSSYKLLGLSYFWIRLVEELSVDFSREGIPDELWSTIQGVVQTSQTHGAFTNLIDGRADVILTHRTMSPDERAYADARGVTLLEAPVAFDSFVFVVNRDNPVRSLTAAQIRDIYTGRITNWSEVGGPDLEIMVFTRPRNSGSEEIFRTLVMRGEEPARFPEAAIGVMAFVFREVKENRGAICYSFGNYKDVIAETPDSEVPTIAVDGVFPTVENVRSGAYPFISQVHVAVRSGIPHGSMTMQLYQWFQSDRARSTIAECGFIP